MLNANPPDVFPPPGFQAEAFPEGFIPADFIPAPPHGQDLRLFVRPLPPNDLANPDVFAAFPHNPAPHVAAPNAAPAPGPIERVLQVTLANDPVHLRQNARTGLKDRDMPHTNQIAWYRSNRMGFIEVYLRPAQLRWFNTHNPAQPPQVVSPEDVRRLYTGHANTPRFNIGHVLNAAFSLRILRLLSIWKAIAEYHLLNFPLFDINVMGITQTIQRAIQQIKFASLFYDRDEACFVMNLQFPPDMMRALMYSRLRKIVPRNARLHRAPINYNGAEVWHTPPANAPPPAAAAAVAPAAALPPELNEQDSDSGSEFSFFGGGRGRKRRGPTGRRENRTRRRRRAVIQRGGDFLLPPVDPLNPFEPGPNNPAALHKTRQMKEAQALAPPLNLLLNGFVHCVLQNIPFDTFNITSGLPGAPLFQVHDLLEEHSGRNGGHNILLPFDSDEHVPAYAPAHCNALEFVIPRGENQHEVLNLFQHRIPTADIRRVAIFGDAYLPYQDMETALNDPRRLRYYVQDIAALPPDLRPFSVDPPVFSYPMNDAHEYVRPPHFPRAHDAWQQLEPEQRPLRCPRGTRKFRTRKQRDMRTDPANFFADENVRNAYQQLLHRCVNKNFIVARCPTHFRHIPGTLACRPLRQFERNRNHTRRVQRFMNLEPDRRRHDGNAEMVDQDTSIQRV
eukprot:gene10734-11922_t